MTGEATKTAGRVSARRLQLDDSDMRRLGYRVVDLVVDHLAGLHEAPIGRRAGRDELERLLREPLPRAPGDPDAVLERARWQVLEHILHLDHPRCFAFVPGPGNFVGTLADALVAGLNPFAGTWLEASGPAEVELVTLEWLRELLGLPPSAGGAFVSGGSIANLTALAVGRAVRLADRDPGAVIYASDQAHASIARGARTLGFGEDQLRVLRADARQRLVPEALREAIRADRWHGLRPFAVVATAGTTSTGAVDPLAEIADICGDEDLWLHVDGAYGAAAVFSRYRAGLLAGIERADSLSLDPHKWLFQPYEIGCLLVRDRAWLPATFGVSPAYLRDAQPERDEVNFADHGVQLTRSFRALKLWMTLKVFGADAVGDAIDHGFRLAELAEEWLADASGWETVSPARMGIVCFRYRPAGLRAPEVDALNERIAQRILDDGFALVVTTLVDERPVLRLCTINPRTTPEDVEETLRRLDRHARALWP